MINPKDGSQVIPPFSPEEVENLNLFQEGRIFHPFTCGGSNCRENLVATEDGWICPKCDYTQKWAHNFMAHGVQERLDNDPVKKWRENWEAKNGKQTDTE